jgi:preprotein translocase subunit SecD
MDVSARWIITIRTAPFTFTDDGARKMHDLAAAQMNKIIAMILDGKVIFAPKVRSADVTKTAQLTGNSPSGLTSEQVQRILESVNKK